MRFQKMIPKFFYGSFQNFFYDSNRAYLVSVMTVTNAVIKYSVYYSKLNIFTQFYKKRVEILKGYLTISAMISIMST